MERNILLLLLYNVTRVYSQDLRPRWQSIRCLDQLQIAAGNQIAETGTLDRAMIRLVVYRHQSSQFGGARVGNQREEADGQEDRAASPPLGETATPRHRRARHRVPRTERECLNPAGINRSPRDAAHPRCCAAPSSRIPEAATTTTPTGERIAMMTKKRRPSTYAYIRSRQNKLCLFSQKRNDPRTMMTPTGPRGGPETRSRSCVVCA